MLVKLRLLEGSYIKLKLSDDLLFVLYNNGSVLVDIKTEIIIVQNYEL